MSLPFYDAKPLDPNLMTGPFRLVGGPNRIRAVTTDTMYGEFATYLYVGTAGDVSIVTWDGTTVILNNLAAGVWHKFGSVKVNTSGTTALNIRWGS